MTKYAVPLAGCTPDVLDQAVMIQTLDGCGSGVFVADDLILTAGHVVDTAETVTVIPADGTQYAGAVLRRCETDDLALIRCETPGRERRPVIGHATLRSEVEVIGAPYGVWPTVTRGIVSGEALTDAAAHPGSSGGRCSTVRAD